MKNKITYVMASVFGVWLTVMLLPNSCFEQEDSGSSTAAGEFTAMDEGDVWYDDGTYQPNQCTVYMEIQVGDETRVYRWTDEGCMYAYEIDKGRPPDAIWVQSTASQPEDLLFGTSELPENN